MRARTAAVVGRAIVVIALASACPMTARADAVDDLARIGAGLAEITRRVNPSIVQVFVSGYTTAPVAATPGALVRREHSSGSGVIVDTDGYVITNAHVVAGGDRIRVRISEPDDRAGSILQPRGPVVDATLVGLDLETDLAVLQLPAGDYPALSLGDSDAVAQGELVFAFGSPFELENSVSMGVISAIARQLEPEHPMIYFQTDATINPGNSGGPLVDTRGRVIGINTLIFSRSGGSDGLGFAAPSNIVSTVFRQLRKSGRVARGEIGVHAQTITPTLARALGLPRDRGVILGDVAPRSPAALAGLRPRDIVLSLDGKTMENGRQLDVNVYQHTVGENVTVEVLRGSERRTFQVPVVERLDDPNRFLGMVRPEENLVPELGVLGITITSDLRRLLPPLRIADGVVVAGATPRSPLDVGQLRPGDVIHALNGVQISSLEELKRAAAAVGAGEDVAVQIERTGQLSYVAFERAGR